MSYQNLLEYSFKGILKNNSEKDLDISSKENLSLNLLKLETRIEEDYTIIECDILESDIKIGKFKIVLDTNKKLIDEFFIIY